MDNSSGCGIKTFFDKNDVIIKAVYKRPIGNKNSDKVTNQSGALKTEAAVDINRDRKNNVIGQARYQS